MDFKDPSNFVWVKPELSPGAIEEWLSIVKDGKKMEKGNRRSDFSTKVKKHLSALGWVFSYAHKGKKRELRYKSPNGKWFYSLATACMSCCVDEVDDSRQQQQKIVPKDNLSYSLRNLSFGSSNFVEIVPDVVDSVKIVPSFDESKKNRKRVNECDDKAPCFYESDQQEKKKKRKRVKVKDCDDTTAFNGKNPNEEEKNPSSNLIKIVPNIGVLNQQQNKRMKTDNTTAFSKSTVPKEDNKGEIRPRIGKPLRKILEVMDNKNKKEGKKESLRFWRKDFGSKMNCNACCICHFGGELLLCDGCPSAFHHTCLGLKRLPEEALWFCPCCCCDICKSVETPSSENSMLMSCEQCRRRFHLKCLKGSSSVVSLRGWFCSSQCDRVFTSLQKLLGCKISLGDDLALTLMRAPDDFDHETISKLNSAVEILHQGFELTKDPFSGKDLVEELIFRRERGYYTVIVERKKEPITVAAIRVGKDEAEIPLVATRCDYRRRGMCRLLMNELEKQMCGMGVFRLVLPSATEVLTTWTHRFGFSEMESWERLEAVKHGMLDFAGTVMCQKFLLKHNNNNNN